MTDPPRGETRVDNNSDGALPFTDGATLVVFYVGGGAQNQVMSDFSYDTNTDADGAITRSFGGINSVGGAASLILAGPDGQGNGGETFTLTGSEPMTLTNTFDGSDPQDGGPFDDGYGSLWDTDHYDVSSILPAGQATLKVDHTPEPATASASARRSCRSRSARRSGAKARARMLQGRWENLPAMQPILDIADLAQRREAAEATADGAALFYAFGNFCALAARPDLESLQAMNRLKGRPLRSGGQRHDDARAGASSSSTGTACSCRGARSSRSMADLHALGPIGFRGPAARARSRTT